MQPIEITTSKSRIVLVEVPDEATNITIDKDGYLNYHYAPHGGNYGGMIDVLNCEFLATTKTITEDLAKEVVDLSLGWFEKYRNYIPTSGETVYGYYSALESFSSLLQASGVDVSKVYAVLIVK